MIFFNFRLLAQIDIGNSIINFAIVALIAFFCIVGIASYLRFHEVINFVKSKSNDADIGNINNEQLLKLHLAAFLTKSFKGKTPFIVVKFLIPSMTKSQEGLSPLIKYLESYIRSDDKIGHYSDDVLFLITQCEYEDSLSFIDRLISNIINYDSKIIQDELRIGVSSYPYNGTGSSDLIDALDIAFKKASAENPIIISEIDSNNQDTDDEESENSNIKYNTRIEKILDPITGVLKEKVLSTYLQRRMSELRLKKQPCIILCIKANNIGYTKEFYGKESSENLLAGVSNIIQRSIRDSDIIGTYENDKFMILAECNLSNSEVIAKRISKNAQVASYGDKDRILKTTLSIGVSSYPEHGNNLHRIYSKAQKALDYCFDNDIRGYVIYDDDLHGIKLDRPKKSVKSKKA